MRLHAHQMGTSVSKMSFQIFPGRIGAFGHHIFLSIQDGVEYLQPKVGGTDFIKIRKCKDYFKLHGSVVFSDPINFSAQISTRLFDKRQDILKGFRCHAISLFEMASTIDRFPACTRYLRIRSP